MIVLPGQDVADKYKRIRETKTVERVSHMTIDGLFSEHSRLSDEIEMNKVAMNNIVTKLIEIDRILPVENIPVER